jgi:hypothetical protein
MNLVLLIRLKQFVVARRPASPLPRQVDQPAAAALPVVADADADIAYVTQRVPVEHDQISRFSSDLERQRRPYVGFHLTGECPRCHHQTSDVFAVRAQVFHPGDPVGRIRILIPITTSWWRLRKVRSKDLPSPTLMQRIGLQQCRCIDNHPNSDGKFGCGASWLVKTSFDLRHRTNTMTVAAVTRPDEAKYWPPADAFAATIRTLLDDVQASAAKWQTGLTAVLGR